MVIDYCHSISEVASYLIVAVPGWLGLLTQMFSTEVQGEMDRVTLQAELGPVGTGRRLSRPLQSRKERERERGGPTSGLQSDPPPPPSM